MYCITNLFKQVWHRILLQLGHSWGGLFNKLLGKLKQTVQVIRSNCTWTLELEPLSLSKILAYWLIYSEACFFPFLYLFGFWVFTFLVSTLEVLLCWLALFTSSSFFWSRFIFNSSSLLDGISSWIIASSGWLWHSYSTVKFWLGSPIFLSKSFKISYILDWFSGSYISSTKLSNSEFSSLITFKWVSSILIPIWFFIFY